MDQVVTLIPALWDPSVASGLGSLHIINEYIVGLYWVCQGIEDLPTFCVPQSKP